MKLIIDIPERSYFELLDDVEKHRDGLVQNIFYNAIADGTPLPKGHGDLIERNAALDDIGLGEFHRYDDYAKMRNYLKSIPTIIESSKEV